LESQPKPADVSALKGEIRGFFVEYCAAMIEAIQGDDGAINKLEGLFAVPSTLVTGDAYLALSTPEDLHLMLQTYIDRLRAMNFAQDMPEHSDLRLLNEKACIIEAQWVRRDGAGAVMSSNRILYVIADTGLGWRVVTVTMNGIPRNEARINPVPGDDPTTANS
jgi:hypothetical protein